jgi:hypothetical protein
MVGEGMSWAPGASALSRVSCRYQPNPNRNNVNIRNTTVSYGGVGIPSGPTPTPLGGETVRSRENDRGRAGDKLGPGSISTVESEVP